MGEGNCYFCKKKFWTEHISICLDCLRHLESLNKADFVFIAKGEYISILSDSDLLDSIEFLEEFVLPSLKRKLKEKKKELEKQERAKIEKEKKRAETLKKQIRPQNPKRGRGSK